MATITAITFARYPYQQLDAKQTALEFGLCNALTRIFWSISLCYIIFACIHNSGGYINAFLGHQLWQPLSRLSYSIYLLHYPVIRIAIFSAKSTSYYTEFMFYQLFFGFLMLSVFVSIIGSLSVELPVQILEKLLFHQRNTKKTNENELIEAK